MSATTVESRPTSLERVAIDDPAWVALLDESPSATLFHHPAWARVVSAAYGFETFALVDHADGARPPTLGIPCVELGGRLRSRRWVALPFTDHCPPLGEATALARLTARLDSTRRAAGIRSLEVHGTLEGSTAHRTRVSVRHALALGGDAEELFRSFHRSQVQRNILRAKREGVTVRHSREPAALLTSFYRLHALTRRRQGTPVQPRRFFTALYRHVIEPGLGWVSLASLDGEDLAAAVFLSWNGTTVYKFGASDERRRSSRPNHAIFWDAIQWSVENEAHTFDFGRTELDQEGLKAFKRGWGAEELPLEYFCLSDAPPRTGGGRVSRVMTGTLKRSPVWGARLVGEIGYRFGA